MPVGLSKCHYPFPFTTISPIPSSPNISFHRRAPVGCNRTIELQQTNSFQHLTLQTKLFHAAVVCSFHISVYYFAQQRWHSSPWHRVSTGLFVVNWCKSIVPTAVHTQHTVNCYNQDLKWHQPNRFFIIVVFDISVHKTIMRSVEQCHLDLDAMWQSKCPCDRRSLLSVRAKIATGHFFLEGKRNM